MKIVTDTGTLYSPEEGKKIGIDVLPLNVIVDKKSYKEYVDIQSDEFLKIVNEGHVPSSSQPSVGLTMEVLEESQEETLVIHMADGLSGTYQSTLGVKATMEKKDHIHVMNSMTLCGPERYLVQKAMKLRDEGKALNDIMQALHKSIATECSFLIPQDFDFLKRGGRLTPLAAKVGSMLKIVPIMTMTKDAKRLETYGMKKTYKGAIKEIIKHFKNIGVDDSYKIYISHAGVLQQAQATLQQIQVAFENVSIEILDLSPAFITQGGPGCIAIQTIQM